MKTNNKSFPYSTNWLQLNDFEIRKGKKIGVTISFNNHRLFVGNIPKNRDRDELIEEFAKHARKLIMKINKQTNKPKTKKIENYYEYIRNSIPIGWMKTKSDYKILL